MAKNNLKKVTCPMCGASFFPRTEHRHKCTNCNLYFFKKSELPTLKCKKCGHKWSPRKTNVAKCPKCGSFRWNNSDSKWVRKDKK
jgi:uncharacterized OB-fold protein